MKGNARPSPLVVDLVAIGALNALLRLPLVLATTPLSYDDGVYGASVVAMRDGARQYRDVFSGQGPLYLPLLRLGDLLGFQARWAPRVSGLLAAVLLGVVASWIVHRVAGRAAALATGVLLATSGQLVATFGSIEADALVVAAGTVAVALALAGRGPLAVGVAAGVALSIKHLMAVAPVRPPSPRPRAPPWPPPSCARSRGASARCGTSRWRTTSRPGPPER
jgi:hypothetical protein